MNKKSILLLVMVLAIAGLVFMFVTDKEKKKRAQAAAPPLFPVVQANGLPTLATPPLYGPPNTYPATQPIQTAQGANNNVGSFPIGIGSTGLLVKMIQAALNLKVDGIYSQQTELAVKGRGLNVSTLKAFTDNFVSVDGKQYAANFPLQKGKKNNYIKAVQIMLGITPDGAWGNGTEKAVLAATGKSVIYHADYTTLLAAVTGYTITYNFKKVEPSKIEKVKDGIWSVIKMRTMLPI